VAAAIGSRALLPDVQGGERAPTEFRIVRFDKQACAQLVGTGRRQDAAQRLIFAAVTL